MEKIKNIHGFEFFSEIDIPELEGTLREAVYTKNGAKLLFIDRKDTNKTFAITFKTIPSDSTGVFHILEHSVLCGSDKYPVKEPFVELLKSSVKTFLNAFTFPDKTMYPVSSRNDKDFLNLVDVYMDAVLHPTALKKPEIFYQEGWHYELCEGEDTLRYKGVVFNEMKGAYSSADEVMMSEIASLLYDGSVYGKDSGGDPKVIPTLTYDRFVMAHKKYYHPSNARIILDGDIDLDKTLALLDSFLSEYDKIDVDTDIPFVQPKGYLEKYIDYEIAPSESAEGKCRLCLGFASSDFSERRKILALGVISDAIAGSNEAPFKKAMLDSGICEDVNIIPYDGIQQNSLLVEIKNIRRERLEDAKALALDTIRKIVADGIDKKLLLATFNSVEFRIREQDMATYPAGICYAIAALDTWLYGADAKLGLAFEDDIAFLRDALDTDYYEKILSDVILDSKHSAALYMIPSPTLGEEAAERERAELARAYEEMSDAQRQQIIKLTKEIDEWQSSDDTPEAIATLPKLLPSDIESEPEPYPAEQYVIDGVPVLYTNVASRGITYTNLLFDVSDFNEDELFLVSILCDLLKNMPTDKRDALGLQTLIKTELGSLSLSALVSAKDGKVMPYMNVSVSSLNSRLDKTFEILPELLLHSLFDCTDVIGKLVRQIKCDDAESIGAAGHSVALSRSMAYVSREAAVGEYLSGLERYLRIKELDLDFDIRATSLSQELSDAVKRIFTKARLTVCYAGERNDDYVRGLTELFPYGENYEKGSRISPLGARREGIIIPAGVAFAAKGGCLISDGERLCGSVAVARSAISFVHLWNNIRVRGGAYGAGFAVRRNSGNCGFYTYRDPDPARSVGIFCQSADYLRTLAKSDEDITGFIIGAIGDSDPLMTPKVVAALSFASYLRGETYEMRRAYRAEMLSTSRADLLKIADQIERAFADCGVCIALGRDKLLTCKNLIDSTIEI